MTNLRISQNMIPLPFICAFPLAHKILPYSYIKGPVLRMMMYEEDRKSKTDFMFLDELSEKQLTWQT